MDEIRIWKIGNSTQAQAFPLEPTEQTATEKLLEDVLTASPELMMSGMTVLGRQLETTSGPLDILGVSEEGKLVVFELKRGLLTRDAVAQVFDYASYLAELSTENLYSFISQGFSAPAGEGELGFKTWYESKFQGVEIAGKPSCVLVGLGVDERAKRMVRFLAESGVDIAVINFHGFRNGQDIFLARQVEVAARSESQALKKGKAANLSKINSLLDGIGMREAYDATVKVVKQGLSESAYAYPFPPGYFFSLPGMGARGVQTLLAYIALYISEKHPGRVRVYLQPRAVSSLTEPTLNDIAGKMESVLTLTPGGYGEFWIDLKQQDRLSVLLSLAEGIRQGWLKQRSNDESTESLNS